MRTFEKCFAKKKAVVTGGSSGIGLSTVKFLRELGCQVFTLDVQSPPKSGKGATHIDCDISSESDLKAAVKQITSDKKSVDFLFANAGIHTIGDILDADWEEVEKTFAVNLRGTFLTLRHFLPFLTAPGGSVVINASDQALVGKGTSAAYGATKGALGQLTKGQALRFIEQGIRINAVCPGGVNTPMETEWAPAYAKKYGGTKKMWAESSIEGNPLRRLIEPEEVAQVVLFLLSPLASAVNGALWTVDGGFTAG